MLLRSGWGPNAGWSPVTGRGSPPAVGGVLKPPACWTPKTDRRLPSLGPSCHYLKKHVYIESICLQGWPKSWLGVDPALGKKCRDDVTAVLCQAALTRRHQRALLHSGWRGAHPDADLLMLLVGGILICRRAMCRARAVGSQPGQLRCVQLAQHFVLAQTGLLEMLVAAGVAVPAAQRRSLRPRRLGPLGQRPFSRLGPRLGSRRRPHQGVLHFAH